MKLIASYAATSAMPVAIHFYVHTHGEDLPVWPMISRMYQVMATSLIVFERNGNPESSSALNHSKVWLIIGFLSLSRLFRWLAGINALDPSNLQ